jgi:putative ABC transport system substrate-binding protein
MTVLPSRSASDNRKSAIRNPKCAGIFAIAFAFAFGGVDVRAQQPKTIPRIGYLSGNSPGSETARTKTFRQGLRDLGYVEGKNISIEWRFAEQKLNRLPTLAAELVNLGVDVIVTGGPGATRPANEATNTIPIVMTQDADPVGNGFVVSLARPGGNITGLSTLSPELSGKRLEILKETVPKLSRVGIIGTSTNPTNAQALRETDLAGEALGIKLQYFDVRSLKDVENAFQAGAKSKADAVLLLGGPMLATQRRHFAELALKNRLPAMYWRSDIVAAGGLMSYSVSFTDLDRRAATYVDKILKGAKPAELPVEQPTKFELVINLKAAKQIGLVIPPNVLARADKVIK